jgi:tRNA threonylcarbamoyladenosine biosynthesis protein TsaB
MNLLIIETAGQLCSVVLQVEGSCYERSIMGSRVHSEHLLDFVSQLLEEANASLKSLDAIAYSAGPGSFTGIRLAASVAKSLAYASNKPVITLSSLQVIAASFLEKHSDSDSVTVLMDARMGDVYLGCYQKDGMQALQEDRILSVNDASLTELASPIVGDAQHLYPHLAIEPVSLDSKALIRLAELALTNGAVESALASSPIYLRDKSSWKTLEEQRKHQNHSENK